MGAKPSLPSVGQVGNAFKSVGNTIVGAGNTAISFISDPFKKKAEKRVENPNWLPPPTEGGPPLPVAPPDITNILNAITILFNELLTDKTIYANNQIVQVNRVFDDLTTNTLAQVTNLVEDIRDENILIQNQIDYNNPRINKSKISTWVNQQPYVDSLKYQNHILYIVFYILVLVLGGIMFYMNNTSFLFQAVVFHVLLIYPFLMYYLELILYIIYTYLYAFLYGVPYKSVYIGNMDIKFI